MSRIIPFDNNLSYFISKYSKNAPRLNWESINYRANKSLWDIFRMKSLNIVFCDPNENEKWFVIEYPINDSNMIGQGFFFNKNLDTGLVDLIYETKFKNKKNKFVIYKDCRYFGVQKKKNEDVINMFSVSNLWQDKSISSGLDLSNKYSDFIHIVYYINDFIQNAISNNELNSLSTAYPLLKINDKDSDSEEESIIAEVEPEFIIASAKIY